MICDRRATSAPVSCLLIPSILLILATGGCRSLSYDDPRAEATATQAEDGAWPAGETARAGDPASDAADAADSADTTEASPVPTPRKPRRETPTRARLAERSAEQAGQEPARSWRELARLSRERAQEGELEEANELLAQAALQVADRRPTSTQRRTVFGLRARFAHDLAALGKLEAADALADQLFEEARREPALGDAALVTLARTTADRRHAAALEAGRKDDSQLPLLTLAFDTAQSSTASRERLGLAFEVSSLALRAGELDLARRAIDQCIADARVIAPADRMQTASLKVYKARIALAQDDLETAEATAHAATEIFEELGADASNRGVAETTLAQIVAEKGDLDRGLELARAAYGRLSGSDKLVDHARRQISSGLARVERLAGEREAALAHYREALSAPSDGSTLDEDLIRSIKTAISELETRSAAPANEADPNPAPAAP
ncbi:hypothetical protein K2X89_01970 [Myxococcota bacterium]|nr:hypothetical protein [Myxococcota bacterium]